MENMEWNYDDLSDSEDSEWEDPGQRSIRLSVERYNLDFFRRSDPYDIHPSATKEPAQGV